MGQSAHAQYLNLRPAIDSIMKSNTQNPFSGTAIVWQLGSREYQTFEGYAKRKSRKKFNNNSQFIIGSISKQFTDVMVLQELDKGHLKLSDSIRKYLPFIKQPWADSVTINHLLLHMHGIVAIDKPLLFKAGTQFDYYLANTGYNLLAQIVEKTSGQSFASLSAALFAKCGMQNTFHPDNKHYKHLVNGYTEQNDGKIIFEKNSFQNAPAAGGFISTAYDLIKWNQSLHRGKLLKPETYDMMITPQPNAIRIHPLFGITEYGYGITLSYKDSLVQWGQTGFAPGFISMNFFFPVTQTSLIILGNVAYDTNDLKQTFYYHTRILNIVREALKQ